MFRSEIELYGMDSIGLENVMCKGNMAVAKPCRVVC